MGATAPALCSCYSPGAGLAEAPDAGFQDGTDRMTNAIAITLALLIAAIFAIDAMFFGASLPVFLGKRLAEFIEYLSFWR